MTRSHVKYQIARDDGDASDYFSQHNQEFQTVSKKEPSFWKNAIRAVLLISIYFVFSIGLTFYQQWLYRTYGFHFPLSVVFCHLIIKFLLSALVRCIRTCYKGQPQVKPPFQSLVASIGPPGIASGFDVALSNWALALISVSLYTMTKSTTIVFILAFSLIFNLEKKSWALISIVVMISGGLFMFTYKSTQFGILGFILCLLASFSSGIRWTTTQLVMQKSKLGLQNPIDMMYYLQPWMLLPVIPIGLWFEGSAVYSNFQSTNWNDVRSILSTSTAIAGGAIIAFHMEIMEFLVITYTSSLTLSISGIPKDICMVILAIEWYGDQISGINFIGLLICLGGIVLHVVQKVLASKSKTIENMELQAKSAMCNNSKIEDGVDMNLPLLTQKSTSLTNLLNADFSSEDDNEFDENSSQILSDILQRREQ